MRTIPGRWLAALWITSALLTMAMLHHAREYVTLGRPPALVIVAAIASAGWVRYELSDGATAARRMGRDLAEHLGLFAVIALIGAVASYPDAAASSGFADPALAHVDRLLGFDWDSWYRIVAAHPLLQIAGRLAYLSIFVSPAILLGHYAITARKAEARTFLLAFWTATAATLLLFPCFAAVGPLAYTWHGPIPYMPVSALYQTQLIPALRSHAVTTIDAASLRGLVEAPSFHATCAILYAAFAWRERTLRWPFAALNGLMLLATPVEGTHYLVDIILGMIVGIAASAAGMLAPRLTAGASGMRPSRLLPSGAAGR
jgi:hypothetical protein